MRHQKAGTTFADGDNEKDIRKVITHDSSDNHENQLLDVVFTFVKIRNLAKNQPINLGHRDIHVMLDDMFY